MLMYNLTSKDIEGFFGHKDRVSDLFSWLEGEFASQGQLVCRFVINGKKLTEKEELDWAVRPLSDMQTLQILVQGEYDLIRDVIQLWIEALPEIEIFVEEVLLEIPQNDHPSLIKAIGELTEQQDSFVESLLSLKAALGRIQVKLSSWDPLEQALHQYISQCIRSLDSKNYLQLLRTVEYDGCEVFRRWKDQLTETLAEVNKKRDQNTRTVLDLSQLQHRSSLKSV
jgi:hypothetical protein